MKANELLDQILPILHSVKDDEEKLQRILDFLLEEIFEEPDDTAIIPDKYREMVHSVAERIDCGLVCFINPDTLEIEDIPVSLLEEEYSLFSEEDEEGEEDKDGMRFYHDSWERYITVEQPHSSESFGIMERFTDEVDDSNLKRQLISALNRRKPFANFKSQIDQSEYREKWFAFKQQELEKYVWTTIEPEL